MPRVESQFVLPGKRPQKSRVRKTPRLTQFRCVKIKCGKKRCRKCPHGPYWYMHWWEGGKMHEKYIGKELVIPPDVQDYDVVPPLKGGKKQGG
jgi:hypothetical protein